MKERPLPPPPPSEHENPGREIYDCDPKVASIGVMIILVGGVVGIWLMASAR